MKLKVLAWDHSSLANRTIIEANFQMIENMPIHLLKDIIRMETRNLNTLIEKWYIQVKKHCLPF